MALKYIPRLRGLVDARVEREIDEAFAKIYSYVDEIVSSRLKGDSPDAKVRDLKSEVSGLLNQLLIPLIGEQADSVLTQLQLSPDSNSIFQLKSEKNLANGYAGLDSGGKVLLSVIQEVMALNDLTDTIIAAPANGHILVYESASSKWKNVTPASLGTGINTILDYLNL